MEAVTEFSPEVKRRRRPTPTIAVPVEQLHKLLLDLEWCLSEEDETRDQVDEVLELIAEQAPDWYAEHVIAPFELELEPDELDGLCRLCRRRRTDVGFELCSECARTAGGAQ